MFTRGMRMRVSYERIFALFALVYVTLPLLFTLVVVPLRVSGIIPPSYFVLLMLGEGVLSVAIYLRIVYVDHVATTACLRGIFGDYEWLREDLRQSAELQWADAE